MKALTGIYHNGQLKLKKPLKTKRPIRVTISFEEEKQPNTHLALSDFSFLETQELLKDYKGSFADEVIKERRKAR